MTIVVGYRKDAIQCACGRRFGELKINYLDSSVFDCTGSDYSLWLTRDVLLAGDCLVLEGDVLFEQGALSYLMSSEAPDVAAVVPFGDLPQGAAILLSDSGCISGFYIHEQDWRSQRRRRPKTFQDAKLTAIFVANPQDNDCPGAGRYCHIGSYTGIH
ncbi:hypothetical protein [Bradyrhizobium sp. DASA03120]|uniref:hypothetical protein n=1 Tax=Bradyrhizobium sp. SMVTL-02 TaxID=3395917 RepID=UPI003F71919B